MSRLTIAPALLTLGLLPACGGADVDDGVFGEYDALEAAVAEDVDGPSASTELAAPSPSAAPPPPVILAPRLDCGGAPCMPAGIGSTPLKDPDKLRAAYFDVAGYPDQVTYLSHVDEEHRAVRHGVWGSAYAEIVRTNAMFVEAGFADCGDSPVEASIALDGGRLEFEDGERTVPERFVGGEKRLEHRVVVTSDTHDLTATIDYTCELPVVFGEFDFELDGRRHHTKVWWSTPDEGEVEIELVAEIDSFVYGGTIFADSRGVDAAVVGVHRMGNLEVGTRTLLSSDAEGRAASGYQQELASKQGLHGERAAFDVAIKGVETGSHIQCASWSRSGSDGFGGPCEGLAYSKPLRSVFDLPSEYSIGWAAAPIGHNGALDALDKDL